MSRRDEVLGTHRKAICAAATRHNARSISLVGSVARGEDREASDCDFLVDFAPGTSLFDIADLVDELEVLLETGVDIVSETNLTGRYAQMADDAILL